MPLKTENREYPYPETTDASDVPLDIKALADAIDADITVLMADTGWKDINLAGSWEVGARGARYRRKANVVYAQIEASPRLWDNGQLLFTLPAGFRPRFTFYGVSIYKAVPREITVAPNGNVTVSQGNTDATVGVVVTLVFPID